MTKKSTLQHLKTTYSLKELSSTVTSEWDLFLKSPCKLNLFLRILGRRENGYHDLASLFQAISFSDLMYFTKLSPTATSDEMICSDTTLAVDNSNLVIKALNLMRSKTGINQYFKVLLDKRVLRQAGLGGGSGNAATAMQAFNVLCGYPGTLDQLRMWSGDIGSDITFFFSTGKDIKLYRPTTICYSSYCNGLYTMQLICLLVNTLTHL